MFDLGDKVRCKITGFEGIVTGKTRWINGCHTSGVRSQSLKDGSPLEVQWFDDPQLELVEDGAIACGDNKGGPDRIVGNTMGQ
jgi:hypothetical protein